MLEKFESKYVFYDLWPARGSGIPRQISRRVKEVAVKCSLVI